MIKLEHEYSFSYDDLRGRIKAKFKRQEEFAAALGMSSTSLSAKLNGKTEFSHEEIAKCIKLLDLNNSDIPRYFFVEKVQKNKTIA